MFNLNNDNMGLWNPATDNKPLPMIYVVKKVKNEWILEPDSVNFKLPSKMYGKMEKHANRIWSSFIKRDGSLGVLLLGLKGAGKTETAKLVCNIAISNGMSVINISEITPNIELINKLNKLKNVVLFIDEYGKMFNGNLQEKSLSMFSDVKDNKKLFLLTENDKYMINRFLLNRPSRLWYKIMYMRLSEDVVKEYCEDHDVDKEFLNELLKNYKTSKNFSFDHLQALVIEHLDYPDETFNDLIEIMNVDIGSTIKVNKILSIRPLDKKINITLLPRKSKYQIYPGGLTNSIDINTTIVKAIDNKGKDVTDKYRKYLSTIHINNLTPVLNIDDNITTYKVNNLAVEVINEEDDGEPDEVLDNTPFPMNNNNNNMPFNKSF